MLRGAVEYGDLYTIKRRSNALIMRTDEMLDQIGGSKAFSKINLKTMFHQIMIKPSFE